MSTWSEAQLKVHYRDCLVGLSLVRVVAEPTHVYRIVGEIVRVMGGFGSPYKGFIYRRRGTPASTWHVISVQRSSFKLEY